MGTKYTKNSVTNLFSSVLLLLTVTDSYRIMTSSLDMYVTIKLIKYLIGQKNVSGNCT